MAGTRKLRYGFVVLAVTAALTQATAPPAHAVVIIHVTTTADAIADDGQCSLREAIEASNQSTPSGDTTGGCLAGGPGSDGISLPAGTYTLGLPGENDNQNLTGDLDVLSSGGPLVILGSTPPGGTVIDGADLDRVFDVQNAAVIFQNLTIQNGDATDAFCEGGGLRNVGGDVTIIDSAITSNHADDGGAIHNSGPAASLTVHTTSFDLNTAAFKGGAVTNSDGATATIINSTIEDNVQDDFVSGCAGSAVGGGAIFNSATVTINDTTIDQNTSDGEAGGIFSGGSSAILTINRSTISRNTATTLGGGIDNAANSDLELSNSTISGNVAGQKGGGIYSSSTATNSILSSTIEDNSTVAAASGDGIWQNLSTPFTLQNSILADECATQPPTATFTSLDHNIDTDDTCDLDEPNDHAGADPLLQPLDDNGSPNQTHSLGGGSPAIDQGVCAGLTVDQRGVDRPQGAACDIGSFEAVPPIVTIDSATVNRKKNKAIFTFSAEPNASFRCQIDSKGFVPCTSPITYKRLKERRHTFSVRATDQLGNDGPVVARKFRV
jgi:CSLREA domain-containing protein